jgi:hypothetical protein
MRSFEGEHGMHITRIVVAAGMVLGCWSGAQASGQADGEWVEAQSLRELPAGIQALLGVGLGAAGGIADRGERYNAADMVVDNLPGRRFALGIVNGESAVVAVERGGRGYAVETVEFHQVGATWEPVRCVVSAEPPHRAGELLDALAAHQPGAAKGAGRGCRAFPVRPQPGA